MSENAKAKAAAAKAKANLAILAAAANINRKHAKKWANEQDALKQIVGLAHPVRVAKTLAKKGGRKQRQTRRQRQSLKQRQNQ
jgi:hypothetical protein